MLLGVGVIIMFEICCFFGNTICNYTHSFNINSRGSLMRLYNMLLVWLGTILLVMVILKQKKICIIIIPNNFCYYNFALKSLPGVVPDKALLLDVGVA